MFPLLKNISMLLVTIAAHTKIKRQEATKKKQRQKATNLMTGKIHKLPNFFGEKFTKNGSDIMRLFPTIFL